MAAIWAARPGDWTKPLDFDLHAVLYGETRTPFAIHVKPKPDPKLQLPYSDFPQYSLLPVELQRHVLLFCDGATLFQLMKIATTRKEAEKLFWSDPNTWYSLDSDWLLHGGHAGNTHRDLDFLAYVTHINIDFQYLESHLFGTRPVETIKDFTINGLHLLDIEGEIPRHFQVNMCRFWRLLQNACPRVNRVLISTNTREKNNRSPPSTTMWSFLRLAPSNLKVAISLLQGRRYPAGGLGHPIGELTLWRLAEDKINFATAQSRWKKVFADWRPNIVIPPPKKFRGPAGLFQQAFYAWHRSIDQERGAELLLIDAIERDHFDGRHDPFTCFAPDCERQFNGRGDYLLHCLKTDHHNFATPPEKFKTAFGAHRQKLERYKTDLPWYLAAFDMDVIECDPLNQKPLPSISTPFDEDQLMIEEIEKEELYYQEYFDQQLLLNRREYDVRRAFLYQLKNDPLHATANPPEDDRLYDAFLRAIDDYRRSDYEFQDATGDPRFEKYKYHVIGDGSD